MDQAVAGLDDGGVGGVRIVVRRRVSVLAVAVPFQGEAFVIREAGGQVGAEVESVRAAIRPIKEDVACLLYGCESSNG